MDEFNFEMAKVLRKSHGDYAQVNTLGDCVNFGQMLDLIAALREEIASLKDELDNLEDWNKKHRETVKRLRDVLESAPAPVGVGGDKLLHYADFLLWFHGPRAEALK